MKDVKEKKNNHVLLWISISIFMITMIAGFSFLGYILFQKNFDNSSVQSTQQEDTQDFTISQAHIIGDFPLIKGDNFIKTSVIDGKISYQNAGSSNCPPIIQKAVQKDDSTIVLTMKNYANIQCADNLQAISQDISYGNNKQIHENTKIIVETF